MEKIKKKPIEMLDGSMWDKILRYALPVAATGILGQLFNASDIAIVGNFADEAHQVSAVAAVGANGPVIGLMLNIFIGISLGANVVIANAIGRGDKDTVTRAVHTSIVAAFLGGVIMAILGEIFAVPLMAALNVPDEVLPFATRYMRIYLVGMPVILLYNFQAAIFRSVGDTKTPLIALAFSGVLNVLLNLFFVVVVHMTVEGVAIATVIANVVSSTLLLRKLMCSEGYIHVDLKKLGIDWGILGRILRIGIPAGLQSAVFSAANIVMQSAINSLGKVVMAANSAAFNVEIMVFYVLNSFGQACTTFVGQNYGAGKMDRCKKALKLCIVEAVLATGLAALIVLPSSSFLLSLFNGDPEVIRIGLIRIKYIFMGFIFSTFYDTMSGYMRGFGLSLIPALLTITAVCGTRITWIYTVFPKYPSFETIMTIFPISLALNAFLILGALLIYHPSRRFDHTVLDKHEL